jgi:DNA (cytosine-5)-methyltransferase 1
VTDLKFLDGFAGTGWGVALKRLGIHEDGVEIMPEACATRELHGMSTIYHDIWEGLKSRVPLLGYDGHIFSPPCQTFSTAGSGKGREALDEIVALIEAGAYQDPEKLLEFGERHDMKTALVLTPLAHAFRDLPRIIVLEQVPTVLPVWEAYAVELRKWGYSAVTGILNAEQYGVPQTRRRAILVARWDAEAKLPTPTHSRYYTRDPKRLDEGVLPWVSMAEALGWGMTARPYLTISGGGNDGVPGGHTGGQDPSMVGGSGARRIIKEERLEGRWLVGSARTNATVRPAGHPAMTITGGHDYNNRVWLTAGGNVRLTVEEAGVLQSYPRGFEFAGSKSKQFLQVGNAVPPLLAEAILREAIR